MSKRKPIEDLRTIMISRTDGLGDVIVTLPIAAAIKDRLPNVEVAYLVAPYTAPIVDRIAEIDRIFTIEENGGASRALRVYRPDAIIFAKPEPRLALDAMLARIAIRVGTGYRLYSGLFTHRIKEHRKQGGKHEARYGVNLFDALLGEESAVRLPELRLSMEGIGEADRHLREAGITEEYIVVHPGSRGSAGAYPAERYAEVARALRVEFPRLSIVVTAGPGEESLAGRIIADAGQESALHLIGGLSLDGFSELLRGARAFVGSSSGPAHLAALVRTPVIGLYPGLPPMWPARWRPLGDHVITLTPLPEEPHCAACGDDHDPENCVARIMPDRVANALREVLRGVEGGSADHGLRGGSSLA